jgi:hypothetical protein
LANGIDYASTVKLSREKYGKNKASRKNEYVKNMPDVHDILIDAEKQQFGCEMDRLKMTKQERGTLRSIQADALPTGHRLYRAGLRPAPICLACEREKDDSLEHAFWGCCNERVVARKKELVEKHGEEILKNFLSAYACTA